MMAMSQHTPRLSEMVATRTEVSSRFGVVSAGHPLAVSAGLKALAAGGNAVDAAVAEDEPLEPQAASSDAASAPATTASTGEIRRGKGMDSMSRGTRRPARCIGAASTAHQRVAHPPP